jgi:predicted dehydrogenase
MATAKKYRVGLIGAGLMGTVHARAYNENPMTQVVAAADSDPETLELFCERFDVPGYDSYEEMVRKEQVDIAAPVLPVKANPDVVIGCAQLGVKAIFCEKPIATVLADADRMVEACLRAGIPFACGDAFRNLPQYWQAKAMIDSGELGKVQSITFHEPTTEISGGGCQGLSIMRLFADDSEVEWVFGWVGNDPTSDEDQSMGGYIQFANGVEGYVQRKPSARRGIEVVCERGAFFCDWGTFHVWKLAEGTKPGSAKFSELEEVPGIIPDFPIDDTRYDAQGWRVTSLRTAASVQSIVDALEKGIPPRTSGDNMRRVLEIAMAFRESHRHGHQRVDLPLLDRSLQLVPHPLRMNNKKELLGVGSYLDRFEVIKKTRN